MVSKYKPVGTPTLVGGEIDFAFEDRAGRTIKGSVTRGVLEDLALILKQPALEPTKIFDAFKSQLYKIAYDLKDEGELVRIDLDVFRAVGPSIRDAER